MGCTPRNGGFSSTASQNEQLLFLIWWYNGFSLSCGGLNLGNHNSMLQYFNHYKACATHTCCSENRLYLKKTWIFCKSMSKWGSTFFWILDYKCFLWAAGVKNTAGLIHVLLLLFSKETSLKQEMHFCTPGNGLYPKKRWVFFNSKPKWTTTFFDLMI